MKAPTFLDEEKDERLTSLCTSKCVSNMYIARLNVAVVSSQKGAPTAEQQMAGPFGLLEHTLL